MRCVTILLDRMRAHVKQDIQEMEEDALVRRFDLFLNMTQKKGNTVNDSCKLVNSSTNEKGFC